MEFLSLKLFNAIKICLSELSETWQELYVSKASSPHQWWEDATPSEHPEKGWGREILWQQGSIRPYGTRNQGGLWFTWSLVPGVSLLILEWKFLSPSLRELSSWQPGFHSLWSIPYNTGLFVGQMSAPGHTFTVLQLFIELLLESRQIFAGWSSRLETACVCRSDFT